MTDGSFPSRPRSSTLTAVAERFPADQRPSTPLWVPVVVVGLAIFGAIALVQFVLGALFGVIKLAIVVAIAVAVIAAVMGRKGD